MNDDHADGRKINWGIHLNRDKGSTHSPCPKWVKPGEKSEWSERGVVIWDEAAGQVTCLSPHQALDVLDDLRETPSWKSAPFCLSWNSYAFPYSEEDRKAWRSSKNQRNEFCRNELGFGDMRLLPDQTQKLFLFLESREDEIQKLAQEHAMEVRKLLGQVYRLILSWRREPSE